MIRKISSGDSYKQRWEKVNQLIDAVSREDLIAGNGVKLHRSPAGTVFEAQAPHQTLKYRSYDGPFCCALTPDGSIKIFDPYDYSGATAGEAYLNGIYTDIPSEILELNDDDFCDEVVVGPDGKTRTVRSAYVCLALSANGDCKCVIEAHPDNGIYDGEFAVEYDQKNDRILILDGTLSAGKIAGYAFLDGEWHGIAAGSLNVKEGVLCLKYNGAGHVSYEIVAEPKVDLYECACN